MNMPLVKRKALLEKLLEGAPKVALSTSGTWRSRNFGPPALKKWETPNYSPTFSASITAIRPS